MAFPFPCWSFAFSPVNCQTVGRMGVSRGRAKSWGDPPKGNCGEERERGWGGRVSGSTGGLPSRCNAKETDGGKRKAKGIFVNVVLAGVGWRQRPDGPQACHPPTHPSLLTAVVTTLFHALSPRIPATTHRLTRVRFNSKISVFVSGTTRQPSVVGCRPRNHFCPEEPTTIRFDRRGSDQRPRRDHRRSFSGRGLIIPVLLLSLVVSDSPGHFNILYYDFSSA